MNDVPDAQLQVHLMLNLLTLFRRDIRINPGPTHVIDTGVFETFHKSHQRFGKTVEVQ